MLWYLLTGALCFVAGLVISNVFSAYGIQRCLAYHFAAKGYSDDAIRRELEVFAQEWRQRKSHKLEEER